MKKNAAANCIMLLIIAILAVCGVLLALHMAGTDDTAPGSQYRIKALADHALLQDGQENTCTVTIVCHSVFDQFDRLETAKVPYIPADGVILPVTTVSFDKGDTAFDVLQRVCEATELPLEYSWTPLYDSYYIEGISHLYEFDCGTESGWMYKVNDWFPNYGCSSYALENGDAVVWCYTCAGMGADVGESGMGTQ